MSLCTLNHGTWTHDGKWSVSIVEYHPPTHHLNSQSLEEMAEETAKGPITKIGISISSSDIFLYILLPFKQA